MNCQIYHHTKAYRRVLLRDVKRSLQVLAGGEQETILRPNDERITWTPAISITRNLDPHRHLQVRTLMCTSRGGNGITKDGNVSYGSYPLQIVCSKDQFSASFTLPSQHHHVYHYQRRWMSTIKNDNKEKKKEGNAGKDSSNDGNVVDEEQETETAHWLFSRLSKQRQNQIDAIITQGQSLPNLITIGRIFSTPILCHWIMNHEYKYAAAGCLVAGLSDYADGYIAKNYNQKTVMGTYLDPLADKILINSIALSLAHVDILPLWCAGLWLGRDVLLFGTAYRMNAIASRGKDHAVIDPSKTTLEVKPTMISKINTVFQFGTIALSLGMAATVPAGADFHTVQSTIDVGMLGHWNAVEGACYLTSCTTILSGLSYIDGNAMSKLTKK